MNRRIAPPQPFAPVDSTETARALARGSAWAFWIWAGVGLMQAGLVWFCLLYTSPSPRDP